MVFLFRVDGSGLNVMDRKSILCGLGLIFLCRISEGKCLFLWFAADLKAFRTVFRCPWAALTKSIFSRGPAMEIANLTQTADHQTKLVYMV